MNESLLKQKIEFLEFELEKVKEKDQNHQKMNESLLQILGKNEESLIHVISIQTQTLIELKNSNEMQRKELQDLKIRHKDELLHLEKEMNQVILENKELEYRIKQQRISLESEKLEIISQLQRLQAEKLSVDQALKSYENNSLYQQSIKEFQTDSKVADLQRQFDIQKEEHKNELLRNRQASEKTMLELKIMYDKEIDNFKQQILQLQARLKSSLEEIESLREGDSTIRQKFQVEELESELEYYKSFVHTGFISRSEDREEFNSIYTEALNSKESASRGNGSNKYSYSADFENILLKNEKLTLDNEKYQIEVNELRNEFEKIKRASVENENKLKNEIKFLIGKLLKAKSKLSTEGELSDSIRRESIMTTIRYGSMQRPQVSINNMPKHSG